SGYQFGNLALTLLEQLNAKQIQSKTLLVVHAFITHCKAHIRDALKPLQNGYQAGIENGDLEFAGYSALTHCQYGYFIGQPLSELAEKMTNYVKALDQLKQLVSVNCLKIYLQSVCNLASPCLHPGRLIGQVYDESEKLPLLQQANDRYGLFNLYTNKVILAYLFQDFYQATANGTLAENYLDGATGHAGVVILNFYTSLAWLMMYPDAAPSEQFNIIQKVTANQEKMKQWAHHAPMNYLHKFYLVEAERHRVLSEPIEAMDDYDQAISLAKQNEYINEEALANELAAKFYLDWGKEKIAQLYLTDAYYAYARWGALAKIEDLEKRYPQLLARILNQEKSVPLGKTIAQITTGTITSTSTGDSEVLDLATVIKASQALSGEIYLDQLLSRLIQVAIENAGASKCVLLLSKAGHLAIAATGVTAIGSHPQSIAQVSVLQSMPIEESQEIPVTLINYVNRTQKTLLLDDASTEPLFATDPYITRQQPKSVLCTPIQNQGKAIGILYLENHLTTGAFTPDRLEVLNIICSQAAISIENAQLYRQVLDREKELRESETRLAQLLEAMPVGVFVADAQGKAYYVNSRAQQLLGKGIIDHSTSEQLREVYQIYLAGSEQLYPKEHDPILCALQGASVNIDNMEIRQPDKVIPIEVWGTPIYDEEGNVAYAIAAFQDITQRQLAEKLITEYNRTLEDQVTQRTQELKNALDHLKATQEELIQSEKMAALGQLIAGVAHEINTPLGAIRASIENITDFFANQLENLPRFLQQLSSENQQYFFSLLNPCTQTEMFLSTREKRQLKRNLTQQLEEQAIENADSVASILLELGVVQDIEPFLSLLKDPDSSSLLEKAYQLASVRKSTKTIFTATERAAKIVFALKNYARYDATSKKVQADITQGIETVLTLYQNQLKQGVQLIRNYQSSPSILCYPDELHQVWTNLIHNALQAMDNQGTITVDVIQHNSNVIVSITDSGKGIVPEIKDRIFEPFFTTKSLGEGSGLGLHIVKTIIDRHDGKIEVSSQPGKTTFTVSLPFNIIPVSIEIN
ncbi:MAG TPA: ATP-binding protein, partial [Coleofasciculaceae cyanobacterium]